MAKLDYTKIIETRIYIYIRAVSVNALIYAINLAAINALNILAQLCLLPVCVEVFALLRVSNHGSP